LLLATTRAEADGYQGNQGTRLHGTEQDLFERVGIPLDSARHQDFPFAALSVRIEAGQLKARWSGGVLEGNQLTGVEFSATVNGQPVTFSVLRAEPHVNVYTQRESDTVWQYQVGWASPTDQGRLCPDGASALVLPGHWESNVFVYIGSNSFSFACMPVDDGGKVRNGGVAAKCVDWGYAPWVSEELMPGSEDKSPAQSREEAVRYHVACTAMASADYCGEARANTLQGTEILMFNDTNLMTQVKEGDPNQIPYVAGGPFGTTENFFFESAWTTIPYVFPKDAGGDKAGLRAKASCLTKKRWTTLPLGGSCMGELPDPRLDNADRYCEDVSAEELVDKKGAVLFSYSRFVDAGLYRFRHQSNPEWTLTTASVNVTQTGEYLPEVEEGLHYKLDSNPFEGTILTRHVPDDFPGMKFTARLLRYRSGTGQAARFVTLVEGPMMSVPQGYQLDDGGDGGVEGYVYTAPPPSNTPFPKLDQWKDAQGHYTATTRNLMQQGYSIDSFLGYLPTLSDYAQMQ
jgi:hypothetical protein